MRIGMEVSAIGLGTLRTFDVTSEEDISVRQDIIDNCIASQVDLIDTAAWYGNAEQVAGETIAGKSVGVPDRHRSQVRRQPA